MGRGRGTGRFRIKVLAMISALRLWLRWDYRQGWDYGLWMGLWSGSGLGRWVRVGTGQGQDWDYGQGWNYGLGLGLGLGEVWLERWHAAHFPNPDPHPDPNPDPNPNITWVARFCKPSIHSCVI